MIKQDLLRLNKMLHIDISSNVFDFWGYDSVAVGINTTSMLSDKIVKLLFIWYIEKNNLLHKIEDQINRDYQIAYKQKNPCVLGSSYENWLFNRALQNNMGHIPIKYVIWSYFNKYNGPFISHKYIFEYILIWRYTVDGTDFWSSHNENFRYLVRNTTWRELIKILIQDYTKIQTYL